MNFGSRSNKLLRNAKAIAKMVEFNVPAEDRATIRIENADDLLYSTIRVLSEFSKRYANDLDISETYDELTFVAKFYENYAESDEYKDYFFLLTGASANFLSDNFGNAQVLIRQCRGLAIKNEIAQLLVDCFRMILFGAKYPTGINGQEYSDLQKLIFFPLKNELSSIIDDENLGKNLSILVHNTERESDAEDFFFARILRAVQKKAVRNSATRLVPQYSGVGIEKWQKYFDMPTSIKVIWEAQRLMMNEGILSGNDATIQLPTGVGKTKSTELIIAAAMMLRNVHTTIVVAPLRALCNEISNSLNETLRSIVAVNELSDVIQDDAEFDFSEKQVVVCTPEKLYFLLRHNTELIEKCGLIIFDEAHMFDDSSRGATYELLVTKVKELLPEDAQKVFISAVLPNVDELNNWLTDGNGRIVRDATIKKTEKSVGFYSAKSNRIVFFEQNAVGRGRADEVYIPRAISNPVVMSVYKRNTAKNNIGDPKDIFPERENGKHVALYLGLRVCEKGSVALYVNSPKEIGTLFSLILKLSEIGYLPIKSIIERTTTSSDEIRRIVKLMDEHYGVCEYSDAAKLGIFPHYGDFENGLRLAIEFAMKEQKIKFVVCTSTLAEGVNLPIRYLIMTTFKDTRNNIVSVRKFQNLFGRTARSGIHAEGSLLCSDARIFDKKDDSRSHFSYEWEDIKGLFNPTLSERCGSAILSLCDRLIMTYDKRGFDGVELLAESVVEYENSRGFQSLYATMIDECKKIDPQKLRLYPEKRIRDRLNQTENIIRILESFVLNEIEQMDEDVLQGIQAEQYAEDLLKKSLAFSLALTDESKAVLKSLFVVVINKVLNVSSAKRPYYNKALVGIQELEYIDSYLNCHQDELLADNFNEDKWIEFLICVVEKSKKAEKLIELSDTDRISIINDWLKGDTYAAIKTKLLGRVSSTVELERICRNAIGFELTMVLNAILEVVKQYEPTEALMNEISFFQKRLKYGLSNMVEIVAYEAGFADRIISRKIGALLTERKGDGELIETYKLSLIDLKDEILELLKEYPSYFTYKAKLLS